jgi:hypothetical protein
MDENLGALDVTLGVEDVRAIDAQAAKIQVSGDRLPEAVLKMTGL